MTIYNAELFEQNPSLLSGNVQIIACAGSGKTEFVAERIATQIANGLAKPAEIVALTFNDAAAEELKFRVRDKIKELLGKQSDVGDMYIGTIHAFAFNILQEFIPKYRGYDMLNENTRKAFAASIKWADGINIPGLYGSLKKLGYRYNSYFAFDNPRYWENWTLEKFLADADFYREESISEDLIKSHTFKTSIKTYLNKLEERRFLDFSGILRLAVDHLEKDDYALNQIRKQYKFFTVDEYQDVNPIQERLIRLVSDQKDVCVVGDDDQSIYQWRGADVENIINFNKNYKKVKTYKLETNRRSHNTIVKCASDFIEINSKRLQKKIIPNIAKTQPGDLYKLLFEHQKQEVDWIIDKIQSLYGKEYFDKGSPRKMKYSDMVLLFRRRNDAIMYKNALENAGISIIYSGMGGLMESEVIQAILRTLRYIGESARDEDTNESLGDIHEAINEIFEITYLNFQAFVSDIITWVSGQRRLSLQGLYYKLLSGLGLADISYHDDSVDDILLYNLGMFSRAISDFENSRTYLSKNDILYFIEFINTHVSNAYDEGTANAMEGLIDAVKIMTLPGTKGLGFPVVFMPHLKHQQNRDRTRVTFLDGEQIDFERYGGSDEDERRLYYVAITRAKKFLFLTTHNIKEGNTKRTGLHPFWAEIDSSYFITQNIPDPTRRRECNIDRIDSDIRFPTNYSELSYYLTCNYDYKMRFVYGFNPGIVQAMGYGKQVHNLINFMHNEYEKTGKIPGKTRLQQLVDEYFYLRYSATKQADILKKSCLNTLLNYIDLWKKDFSLAVKTEQKFEMDYEDKALINGSIDLLSRSEGDENVLEIIDFKTGKQQSQYEEKYVHQVVLYTIAAQEALDRKINKAYIHYLDDKQAERVEVNIMEDKIAETKAHLSAAINGIVQNSYFRKSKKKVCKECDWKMICPK